MSPINYSQNRKMVPKSPISLVKLLKNPTFRLNLRINILIEFLIKSKKNIFISTHKSSQARISIFISIGTCRFDHLRKYTAQVQIPVRKRSLFDQILFYTVKDPFLHLKLSKILQKRGPCKKRARQSISNNSPRDPFCLTFGRSQSVTRIHKMRVCDWLET